QDGTLKEARANKRRHPTASQKKAREPVPPAEHYDAKAAPCAPPARTPRLVPGRSRDAARRPDAETRAESHRGRGFRQSPPPRRPPRRWWRRGPAAPSRRTARAAPWRGTRGSSRPVTSVTAGARGTGRADRVGYRAVRRVRRRRERGCGKVLAAAAGEPVQCRHGEDRDPDRLRLGGGGRARRRPGPGDPPRAQDRPVRRG